MSVAFAVGATLTEKRSELIYNRLNPYPEYACYVDRYAATLVSYNDLMLSRSAAENSAAERSVLPWKLAKAVVGAGARFSVIVASCEDVGLPLALESSSNTSPESICIITHGFLFNTPDLARSVSRMSNVQFLCLSESIRAKMIDQLQVAPKQVVNTGYGVDTDFFDSTCTPIQPVTIVSAGTANRDYRTLLRVTRNLKVRLHIAADSEWHRRPIDISGDHLPTHIRVDSCGTYLKLRSLYSSALFVVVPLYPAPYACGYAVISEAMAMGRAVIATRTECNSDFIEDGVTGFYVRPQDATDLYDKMKYLLNNPDRALRMGMLARQSMAERFSVKSYCERINRKRGRLAVWTVSDGYVC